MERNERRGSILCGRENAVELGGVDFRSGFSPDEVLSEFDFFWRGPLGAKALGDLFGGPTAGEQAFLLGGWRAGDADHGVEVRLCSGLVKQRDDDGGERAAFGAPGLDLLKPAIANAGVEDGFEAKAKRIVGEDATGEFAAAEPAFAIENVRAEEVYDFRERRRAGLDDVAGESVGINDRNTAGEEQFRRGGFAHPDATGYPEEFHGSVRRLGWNPDGSGPKATPSPAPGY
jgi:hypothetical protein